jgi:lysine N6-hydroxylase
MNTHDVIAVGAGPFNLGFAALAAPAGLDAVVLESREGPQWHPGMMLEGTHLQVPFLADLVTLADPTHPLSFLAFLKESGRLYPFYIREDFHALRSEYSRYLAWAARRLPVRYGHRVVAVEHDRAANPVTAPTSPPGSASRRPAASPSWAAGRAPPRCSRTCWAPRDRTGTWNGSPARPGSSPSSTRSPRWR